MENNLQKKFQRKRTERKSEPFSAKNQGAKAPAMFQDLPKKSRIEYLIVMLIGKWVEVQLTNGSKWTGILHTKSQIGMNLILRMVRRTDVTEDRLPVHMVEVPLSEILQVVIKNVNLSPDAKGKFSSNDPRADLLTDSAISSSLMQQRGSGRNLQPWKPDFTENKGNNFESLNEAPQAGSNWGYKWDQFEANQRLFGVTSSYDESLYRKKVLNPSVELQEMADRISQEIANEKTSNIHLAEERGQVLPASFEDEETRFSAVVRTQDAVHGSHSDNLVSQSSPLQAADAVNHAAEIHGQSAVSKVEEKSDQEKAPELPLTANSSVLQNSESTSAASNSTEPENAKNSETEKEIPNTEARKSPESLKSEDSQPSQKQATRKGLNPNAKEFKMNPNARAFSPHPMQQPMPANAPSHPQMLPPHFHPSNNPPHNFPTFTPTGSYSPMYGPGPPPVPLHPNQGPPNQHLAPLHMMFAPPPLHSPFLVPVPQTGGGSAKAGIVHTGHPPQMLPPHQNQQQHSVPARGYPPSNQQPSQHLTQPQPQPQQQQQQQHPIHHGHFLVHTPQGVMYAPAPPHASHLHSVPGMYFTMAPPQVEHEPIPMHGPNSSPSRQQQKQAHSLAPAPAPGTSPETTPAPVIVPSELVPVKQETVSA